MANKKSGNALGGWAFVIGLIIAIVVALFGISTAWPVYVLAILGLIVGLLNISNDETIPFLIAAIAFLFTFAALAEIAVTIPAVGSSLADFFRLVNTFVGPAAAVVAFKALFVHTRN